MGFIKKTTPPPECEEGNVFKARIVKIKKETSIYKDEEREQLRFDCELVDSAYKTRAWAAYYEQPRDKSTLGKLALKLQQATKHDFDNVNEFIVALKTFGYIFLRVKGFREFEETMYPNFAIVTDKLPGLQEKLSTEPKKEPSEGKNVKVILEGFKDIISLGVPLSLNDLGNSVTVADRLTLFKEGLIEQKEGLYFFTDKSKEILKNAV